MDQKTDLFSHSLLCGVLKDRNNQASRVRLLQQNSTYPD